MFCRECGKMLQDGSKFCTGCGKRVEPINMSNNKQTGSNESSINSNTNTIIKKDKVSVGFIILSIFVPLVGLILFVLWKNETPKKAKGILIAALIGFVISLFGILIFYTGYYYLKFTTRDIIKDNKVDYYEFDEDHDMGESFKDYLDDYDSDYDFDDDFDINYKNNYDNKENYII